MIGWAAAVGAAFLLAGTASAQVTCRRNALGSEVCIGLPPSAPLDRAPYLPQRRGVAGVQARPGAGGGPVLVPAWKRDALGNTFLGPGDLPPRRPPLPGVAPDRNCRRDALGNLVCM